MGIFPLKSIILTEGKRKQQVRKNKQQKTLSKQETDPSEKKEVLERPSTRKDMREKGHEQKSENHKSKQE